MGINSNATKSTQMSVGATDDLRSDEIQMKETTMLIALLSGLTLGAGPRNRQV